MLERQKHPFQPYIPQDAIALIIGTAPPWNFCTSNTADLREGEIPFFYGSIHNLFWYIMKAVFEPKNPRWPRNALQCENFLKRWKLGIGDILESFVRQDRKAADDHLSGFKFNSRLLAKLHSEHSEIRFLYFTSQFANELFLKSLKQHAHIYHIQKEDKSTKSFFLTLQHGKKAYHFTCFVLNSPSPRINRSLHDMVEDYRVKFAVVLKDEDA